MAYLFNFSLENYTKEGFAPQEISEGLSERSSTLFDLRELTLKQWSSLRTRIKPENYNDFDYYKNIAALLDNKGRIYPGSDPVVRAELGQNPTPEFTVKKDELKDFVQQHLRSEYRIVFSFGLDENNGMVLFVDIKDIRGNVIKRSEMIEKGSDSLRVSVNETTRKKNYINSLGELPGKRDGIAHVIISQVINQKNEIGFDDFISKYSGEYIYFYVGKGSDPGGSAGVYKKLYFSFNHIVTYATNEIFYDRGGLCCPPAT